MNVKKIVHPCDMNERPVKDLQTLKVAGEVTNFGPEGNGGKRNKKTGLSHESHHKNGNP